MDHMQTIESRISRWWHEKLSGLSLEEACRVYVLGSRPEQYISAQPVWVSEYLDDRKISRYQKKMKWFPAGEPDRRHCLSREELLAETCRITGPTGCGPETVLHRLFAFQPELTYSNYGALCKPGFMPFFAEFAEKASIPYDVLKKELPDEWYISLQIPEHILDRMVWSCRKTGMPERHPCSSRFAERILRLYKKRRGDFIRKYSFNSLKFLWLEYGSIHFPREKILQTVQHYRADTAVPG